jgi:hypothetical protein
MKTTLVAALALLVLVPVLAGCSQRQLYLSAQGLKEQECRKLSDASERQRCLDSAATDYDDYQRQREAAKKPQ